MILLSFMGLTVFGKKLGAAVYPDAAPSNGWGDGR